MKLGMLLGYSGSGMDIGIERVLEAERLGYDSVWTSEAYGSDAITPAAWVLARTTKIKVGTAIIQMPARTPACAAMTVMTLQALSGGRFILGIGPSGPQVVEGWHGVPFGKPIGRTKEYVSIIRKVLAREAPLTHEGEHYQIPYTGAGSSGLAKPLKSIMHGDPSMKIYSASITPAGLRNAAEVTDGVFPIWMDPERYDVIGGALEEGFSRAGGGKGLADFDICPFVPISLGDDLDKCRWPIKQRMALYIGGMGARNKNFYNDYTKRLGYEEAAVKIQDLFLGGRKDEAAAAVPDALVDAVALVGDRARVRDRLQAWKAAARERKVDAMLISRPSLEAIRMLAEEAL